MRTIRNVEQAVAEIKKFDPSSPINQNFLRRLIANGNIPKITSGRRIFIDMDTLYSYLGNPEKKG